MFEKVQIRFDTKPNLTIHTHIFDCFYFQISNKLRHLYLFLGHSMEYEHCRTFGVSWFSTAASVWISTFKHICAVLLNSAYENLKVSLFTTTCERSCTTQAFRINCPDLEILTLCKKHLTCLQLVQNVPRHHHQTNLTSSIKISLTRLLLGHFFSFKGRSKV